MLGKVPFFYLGGGGGWAGAQEGRVISKFLQIGEGLTCFIRNWEKVTVFCCKEKITPCHFVDYYLLANVRSVQQPKICIYKQSFQPRNSGESVPCRRGQVIQKDRQNFGRILFENSVYSPFMFGNHPRSSSFHFSGLAPSLVLAPDVPPTESEKQRASFQKGESANSHNIHKLLHLTS